MPATAPPRAWLVIRSATSSQAKPAIASGASAITEAAMLEGSSCAAT